MSRSLALLSWVDTRETTTFFIYFCSETNDLIAKTSMSNNKKYIATLYNNATCADNSLKRYVMLNTNRATIIAIIKARQALKLAFFEQDLDAIHRCQTALLHLYQHLVDLIITRDYAPKQKRYVMSGVLKWVQWGQSNEAVMSQREYIELCRTLSEEDFATHTVTDVDPDLADVLRDLLSEFTSKSKRSKLKVS